jgi:CubicO group peptidase (beta-lactamase class C family)
MPFAEDRRQILRSLIAIYAGLAFSPAQTFASHADSVSATDKPAFAPIRNRLIQETASGKVTGAVVAVVHKGSIVWEEGFGFADREAGIKATARTPFCLASLTKPFTTTAVMTLAAEGKVSLDEPGNRYLNESKITGPNGDPSGATVRRLGAHVSGLPGIFSAHLPDGPSPAPDGATILRDYGRLAYSPGSIYEYSNLGFCALGVIASHVTGANFGTLMRQRVLNPLGLRDSFFSDETARLPTSAKGYDETAKRIPFYTTSTPPSGELYVSAHDLAHFAMWNLRRKVQRKGRVLDDRWLDELHRPVFVGPTGIATTFGWFAGRLNSGLRYIFKGGGQPGVATKLYMVPALDLACMVLTNQTDGTKLANDICDQILKLYIPDWTPPEEDAGPLSKPFTITPVLRGRWSGMLRNGGADVPAIFRMDANTPITLQLGSEPAADVVQVQSQDVAFEGTTSGLIQCSDAAAFGHRKLVLKLAPQQGKLVGRVTARGTKPGLILANLPYVVSVGRSDG